MSQLQEWSTNFDAAHVEPFLHQITPRIESGFGETEIAQTLALLNDTAHNEQKKLKFRIRHQGAESDFIISIFMDDIDSPDVYFYAPPALCRELGQEMEKFAQAHGM